MANIGLTRPCLSKGGQSGAEVGRTFATSAKLGQHSLNRLAVFEFGPSLDFQSNCSAIVGGRLGKLGAHRSRQSSFSGARGEQLLGSFGVIVIFLPQSASTGPPPSQGRSGVVRSVALKRALGFRQSWCWNSVLLALRFHGLLGIASRCPCSGIVLVPHCYDAGTAWVRIRTALVLCRDHDDSAGVHCWYCVGGC